MKETLIYESKKSKIYYCENGQLEKPFAMKVLNYEFPTPQDISQFYNEYEIISSINLSGIRNVLKKGKEKKVQFPRKKIFLVSCT